MVKRDIENAYTFEHPKYREETSLLKYLNRFKIVKFDNFEILDIKMDSSKADVDLDVTQRYLLKYFMKKDIKKRVIDRWVKFEGKWFHLPEGFNITN